MTPNYEEGIPEPSLRDRQKVKLSEVHRTLDQLFPQVTNGMASAKVQEARDCIKGAIAILLEEDKREELARLLR